MNKCIKMEIKWKYLSLQVKLRPLVVVGRLFFLQVDCLLMSIMFVKQLKMKEKLV